MNILIIDDDRFVTNKLFTNLNNRGHFVEVINKSYSILEAINQSNKYDAIILDLMMRKPSDLTVNKKEHTGEAIFKKLRQSFKGKIIITTGVDMKEITINFKQQKIPVLLKPLSEEYSELYEALYN